MKNKSGFEKFIKGKKKAGTVREEIRQEKRKVRKEIEEKKQNRFKFQNPEYKPQQSEKGSSRFTIKKAKASKDQRPRNDDQRPRNEKTAQGFRNQNERSIKAERSFKPERSIKPERSKTEGTGAKHFEIKRKSEGTRPKPATSKTRAEGGRTRPVETRREGTRTRPASKESGFERTRTKAADFRTRSEAPKERSGVKISKPKPQPSNPDQMPLNKYIAHCGVCSRRDAAELVKNGKVKVNGEVITEPGHKVTTDDSVSVAGKKVHPVKNLVYILLNKPKDYITTTDDPQNRKTVLDLIKQATMERVYPVGRLDRNTSGVLLLTNDGELSQKLTHPSNEIRKIYAVTLNKPLEKKHFDEILKGVELEDGLANVDVLAYTDAKDKTQIGVELHTGRNRIVRRLFEHFGYDVKNLDRVMFAGLTKKNVERGKWRFLNEREVRELKYFRKGK